MSTTDIRHKLHHFIETVDDETAAEIYTLFENEIGKDETRRSLIETERQNYLNGQGESYSWDAVKNMAMNKEERNGLQN